MDKAKIKILFLFVNLNYGGAEFGLLRTLKNINKNEFDCSVVSIEKKSPIGEEIEHLGFQVIYLNSKARLFNLFLITKVVRILAYQRPDILHTCLFYANFFGRVASLFHKPPVIITEEHSMYIEKKFFHVILDKILSNLTDKIIVSSNSVLDFIVKQEGIKKDKFYLIYNAVDANEPIFMPNHYVERLEGLYLRLVNSSGRIHKRQDYSEKQYNGPPDTIYPMW